MLANVSDKKQFYSCVCVCVCAVVVFLVLGLFLLEEGEGVVCQFLCDSDAL